MERGLPPRQSPSSRTGRRVPCAPQVQLRVRGLPLVLKGEAYGWRQFTEDVRRAVGARVVQQPRHVPGRARADPLGVLHAELLPLRLGDGRVDQRQRARLLVVEVRPQGGGQGVGQFAEPRRSAVAVGERGVDGVQLRIDGGVLGLHRVQQGQIGRPASQGFVHCRR